MLTVLGALTGFLSSFAPKVLDLYSEHREHLREVELMKLQKDIQIELKNMELQEANTRADIAVYEAAHESDRDTGIRWVEALRGSVRPVITYAFFLLFAFVEINIMYKVITHGGSMSEVWTEDVQALFAAIICFWFGGRAVDKTRGTLPWLK